MKTPKYHDFLSRHDKWYLGGGNRLVWAPPFPVFLDFPGLWDEAHYYNYALKPLFTWTLLEGNGKPVTLRFKRRTWNPAFVSQEFTAESSDLSLEISERTCVLPSDVAISTVTVRNRTRKSLRLHFIAWTAHESQPSRNASWLTDMAYEGSALSFSRHLKPEGRPEIEFSTALGMNRKPSSYAVNLSEGPVPPPNWLHTPFNETFQKSKLPNEIKTSGVTDDGILFLALHRAIPLKSSSEQTIAVGYAVAPSLAM